MRLVLKVALFLVVGLSWVVVRPGYSSAVTISSKAKAYQYFLLGTILEAEGDYDNALTLYSEVLKLDQKASPEVYYRIASIHIYKEELDKAEDALKSLIARYPDELTAYLWIIRLLLQEDKIDESDRYYEDLLKHSIALSPDNSELYLYLGEYYLKQGERAKAMDCLKKAANRDILDAEPYFLLGVLYEEQGNPNAAISYLKMAIQKDPNHDAALNYLGYLYVQMDKNLDEAQELIERALKISPEEPAYLDSLGWLYFKKGDLDKALDYVKRAAVKEDPEIYYHLAMIYLKKGEVEQARSYLGLALAWVKEDSKLREAILSVINMLPQDKADDQERETSAGELNVVNMTPGEDGDI